jgi:hypothetical protein
MELGRGAARADEGDDARTSWDIEHDFIMQQHKIGSEERAGCCAVTRQVMTAVDR